jgi:hypothetical protein
MRRAPLSRALLVALALSGALAVRLQSVASATTPGTCNSPGPCLVVQLPDGDIDYLDSDAINSAAQAAIAANAPNAVSQVQYDFSNGNPGQYVVTGLSVNAVMQNLLTPQVLSQVTFAEVTVPGSDSGSSFLTAGPSPSNLSAPSNYLGPPTPGLLPVFFVNGTFVDYERPLLNDSDNAISDDTQSVQNGPIDLSIHTGPLLTVTAHASISAPKVAKIGQPISFTASSQGDTVVPTFTWTINGVVVSHQQDFIHKFFQHENYEVQVSAAGSDDSAGQSAPVWVTVGTAHYKGSPKPGGTPTPTPTPSVTPTPSLTPTPTPTASHSGSTTTTSSPTGGSTSGSPAGVAPTSTRPTTDNTAPNGQQIVHGRVIAQTVALLTLPHAAPSQSAVGVSPAVRRSIGWRVSALVASIVAIMLLFAAGAARELRWGKRLRSVVRPR